MTILVGYPINRRAKAVLSLAGMLARSSGEDLLVCTVIPAPWMPGLSRADQGYRSHTEESAGVAVAQARADLPPDVPTKFTTVDARSVPSGILQAAQQHQARMIAVGSSTAGQFGQIRLEQRRRAAAAQLPFRLHLPPGASGPGRQAPAGDRRLHRRRKSGALLGAARSLAHRFGAAFRLASSASSSPRPKRPCSTPRGRG